MNVDKAKAKIKQTWEEKPLEVIAVGAVAVTAAAKLLTAMAETNNSRAWKKEVNRRDRMSRQR